LGGEGRRSLRGRHSVIYPVELPTWIPSGIVEKLTERFQNHLRQEIEIMLQAAEKKTTLRKGIQENRHVSHESESNISVASTNFSVTLENTGYSG
jgi:hypothetical protein